MTCSEVEARLDEYVDGTLGARDRATVDAHLADCTACRATLAALRGLVASARALPQRIEPPRELWTGIAARLTARRPGAPRTARWRERAFWAGVSAAAATLVLALAVYRWTGGGRSSPRPPGDWAVVEAHYERATAELNGTLAAERHRLRPETVALVERHLRLIDAALHEARAALAQDPGNAELRQLVATAARQKVELLEWAARVATAG
jgi:anti-sigma factor RsiW